MAKDNILLCLRKEAGKEAYVDLIPNELKALQEAVGGYIETLTIASDVTLIVNEEGTPLGLPYNCNVCGAELFGTILVVGVDGEEFCSLPGHKIMQYKRVIFGEEKTK